MAAVLEHIRVLDFTQVLSGPTTTRYLAEMGAEVIKVEPPGGEITRRSSVIRNGRSAYFVTVNRGKKSIAIDLKHERGAGLARALAAGVDVVVENFTPGTMHRLGLGWDVLSDLNPRLVMCSISGFGPHNGLSDRPGYDGVAQAYSGFTSLTGDADGPPLMIGASVGDVLTGVNAVAAILAALLHREQTGHGQLVETSLLESYLQTHDFGLQTYSMSDGETVQHRNGRFHPSASAYGIFEATDGHLFIAASVDHHWRDLADAMGRADLVDPEHPWQVRSQRDAAGDEVNATIEAWLKTLPSRDAALRLLEEHRVPAGPVLAMNEVAEHPDMLAAEMVRLASDPVLGQLHVPGFPLHFSDAETGFDTEAPFLGEHSAEVLDGLVTDEELAELHSLGVVPPGDQEHTSRQRRPMS